MRWVFLILGAVGLAALAGASSRRRRPDELVSRRAGAGYAAGSSLPVPAPPEPTPVPVSVPSPRPSPGSLLTSPTPVPTIAGGAAQWLQLAQAVRDEDCWAVLSNVED